MQTPSLEPQLLINDAHGIYIPQLFCQNFIHYVSNRDELKDDIGICLSGPDNEFYFESWDNIERSALLTDDNSIKGTIGNLCDGGDLWFIPDGYEYN